MATRKPLVVVSGRKRELPAGDMVARTDVDIGATLSAIADGSLGAFSHRNKVINGRFAINQSGYVSGAAVDAELYGHDMWKMATAGDTYTYSTTANKTTVTIPAGKVLRTIIEGISLQSGTYVLSWEGTAQAKIGAGSYGASGVTGSITGGTNTTLEFGPGTVANVQLETGTVPTAYEDRPYGAELGLCKRYFQVLRATADYHVFGNGFFYSATNFRATIPLGVEMRATPTLITSPASGFWIQGAGANFVPTAFASTYSSKKVLGFSAAVTGATAGYGGWFFNYTGATPYIAVSARL